MTETQNKPSALTPELLAAANDSASFFVREFTTGLPSSVWLQQACRWHCEGCDEGTRQVFTDAVLTLIREAQGGAS